jgi:uncharacterized pyridoxamine 5'-phosphate oxidase family protein
MNKAVKFLKDCGTFYLATEEHGQPRVRPFGAVTYYKDRIYICTNNQKECFKQMLKNSKIEISATLNGCWIRLAGEAVVDPDINAKAAMIEENPSLKSMYTIDDQIFEVLYIRNPSATIYSFTDKPVVIEF